MDVKQRGLKQIFIMASNNLPRINKAIKAVFPKTKTQKFISNKTTILLTTIFRTFSLVLIAILLKYLFKIKKKNNF